MPAVVVRTPLTRRRAVAAAGVVAAVWGAARLAVWSAERRAEGTPTVPGWRESAPTVTVSLPNGGVYRAENTLAREAVERALPAVNAAADGGFRIDAFEVTIPADATTQVASLLPFLASGAPPDLMVFASWPDPGAPQPDFAGAATTGFFQPLDGPLARDPALPLADFYPVALDLCRHKGALLGVPLMAAPIQLWYDRMLFEETGVPAPSTSWSWEHLLDAARRLTDTADADDANHRYGLSPGWRAGTLLSLIWQRGGDVTSPSRKQTLLAEPAARDAAAFFAGFYGGQPVSARAHRTSHSTPTAST